jgi:hypothetical protein
MGITLHHVRVLEGQKGFAEKKVRLLATISYIPLQNRLCTLQNDSG